MRRAPTFRDPFENRNREKDERARRQTKARRRVAVKPQPKIARETFITSRDLDFVGKKELTAQIGHAKHEWPLVIVKELIDNALNACEETDQAPEIAVRIGAHGITVMDNGPGLPADTIEGVLDFKVRASSREAYVGPARGAQGNALKTIVASHTPCRGTSTERSR